MVTVHKHHHYILEKSFGHQRKCGQLELKELLRSMNTEVPTSRRRLHCSPGPVPPVTPTFSEQTDVEDSAPGTRMSTPINEVLLSDYSVCELPSDESALDTSGISGSCTHESSTNVIVNTALVARIETLKAENKELRCQLLTVNPFD